MKQHSTSIRVIAALAVALGVSACAAIPNDTVTRAAMIDAPQRMAPMLLDIQTIRIDVPRTLEVSEKNRFYPGGDIVWRGEPMGDRYMQVGAIFEDAATRGTAGMNSGQPAVMDIKVVRFHALTEKARYFTGGVHAMTFTVTLRDPATGVPLSAPRRIKADLKGYGGKQAIAADQRGQTQKIRITDHLSQVIRTEMMSPGSYHTTGLGLMGALNTF
jgi:hypothetical protein